MWPSARSLDFVWPQVLVKENLTVWFSSAPFRPRGRSRRRRRPEPRHPERPSVSLFAGFSPCLKALLWSRHISGTPREFSFRLETKRCFRSKVTRTQDYYHFLPYWSLNGWRQSWNGAGFVKIFCADGISTHGLELEVLGSAAGELVSEPRSRKRGRRRSRSRFSGSAGSVQRNG